MVESAPTPQVAPETPPVVGPEPSYSRPTSIRPDLKEKIKEGIAVGLVRIELQAVKPPSSPDKAAQAEADAYVDSLLDAVKRASAKEVTADGLTAEQKTVTIQTLVEIGLDMGIDRNELADRLQQDGLNPEEFLPEPPQETVAAEEPSTDTKAEGSIERTPSAERLGRFSQEAQYLGRRLVNTELPAHIANNEAAMSYQAIKNLGDLGKGAFGTESGKYDKEHPFVLGFDESSKTEIPYDAARLPEIEVVGKDGNPLRAGVRKILGITVDAQGKKFATVQCEVPNESGKSVDIYTPTEPVALEAILDGQVLAEADALSPLFEGDKRAAFDFYVASLQSEEAAKTAYTEAASDTQKKHPDAVLQTVGKALSVPTREDVAFYISKERAKLPKGNTLEEMAANAAGNEELDALAAEIQDAPLITPDVIAKLLHQELGLEGGNIPDQLKGLDGQIDAMKEALKEVIDGGDGDKVQNATRKVQLEGQLQKALQRKGQLEMLSSMKGAEVALDTAMRQYYDKLASGNIAPSDAEAAIKAFRSGNMTELVNAAFPAVPGETAEEFVRRMEMRAKALKVGRGAGIVALIMATLAYSVVEPTQMVK